MFKYYGGRGIQMSDSWKNSFLEFFDFVGLRPSKEHSLDRIDNNGHYEPGNVRWATRIEQANNRRNNRMVTYDGELLSVSQIARKLGINRRILHDHISRGLSLADALAKQDKSQ